MKKIYVAGAYSGPDFLTILGNMRRGMQLSYKVLKAGFAPFVPWFDYQFVLIGEVTLEEFYKYSMAFLPVCDAVLVVGEGHKNSKGTQNEIRQAAKLGIPVFYSLEELIRNMKK